MKPIIDSAVAEPATVRPGQAFVVRIVAHDPDQRTGTLTGKVRDAAGNESQATVQVAISDPLSFELLDADGMGFTIAPRAGQPGVFDVVAPAG